MRKEMRTPKVAAAAVFLLCLLVGNPADAASKEQCSSNIVQLGRDLQVMLAKIPVMPPIGDVYPPLKRLFDEALMAQRQGNYQQCITKTELALRHSRAYR